MKYTIHKDFYYTSNGCDCCEPDRWEFYYISDECGNKVVISDDVYGDTEMTFSSVQEALEFLLEQQGVEIQYEDEEDYDY